MELKANCGAVVARARREADGERVPGSPGGLHSMPQDKQLAGVKLDDVQEKRRLDQALNAKEFAVLAGVSYSTSREWFRLPDFPVFRGVVFWGDFVEWRRSQIGLNGSVANSLASATGAKGESTGEGRLVLPAKAARILADAV